MYFPPTINPQANGYIPQPQMAMYSQPMMFAQTQQQVPQNSFMYPTKLQPYNDRQFLCKTFNFRVPFIEAFLTLSHEEKLKFFLICQSRRLTGELTDKETYSKLLEKIMSIVNPNYKKPQSQQEYKEISEEELKKKILEKEFEQKCEWELRKLGMGKEDTGDRQGVGNTVGGSSFNNIQGNGGGLSMNFDEFGGFGLSNKQHNQHVYQHTASNPDDDDEFVFGDEIQKNQQSQNYGNNNTHNQSSFLVQSTPQSITFQQPNVPPFESQYNLTSQKQSNYQDQQWQEAKQTPQNNNIYAEATIFTPNLQQQIIIAEQKVASIWDLQINQEEIKQSQPNIKQIFGIKSEQDDFGGFEQANVDNVNFSVLSNGTNNQYGSFLKQHQFRYETVAEVSNDWLLGGGANGTTQSGNTHNSTGYVVDSVHRTQQEPTNVQSVVLQPQIHTNNNNTIAKFDINSFDISSLLLPAQDLSQQPYYSSTLSDNLIPDISSTILTSSTMSSFGMEVINNANGIDFDFNQVSYSELPNLNKNVWNQQQNIQKEQDEQWEQGEEIIVKSHQESHQSSNKEEYHIATSFQNVPFHLSQPIAHQQNILNQDQSLPYQLDIININVQNITSSQSYDPFSTVQSIHCQNAEISPNQSKDSVNFSFTSPEPFSSIPVVVETVQKQEISSPTYKEIKPIKKIIKPPSMKNIQIQESNFTHFTTIDNNQHQDLTEPHINNNVTSPKSNVSNYIQPLNLTKAQSPNTQPNLSNAFSKKINLNSQPAMNLSIVPSINIALASSTLLPPASSSLASSSQPPQQQMSASTYFQPKPSPNQQQKIISTYNKQLSYTPDSFRSSIKSMLVKSKGFFNKNKQTFSKQNKQRSSADIKEIPQESNWIEQHSMMDVGYGKQREFLTGSHKVGRSSEVREFSKKQDLDYSIDAHMMNGLEDDCFEKGSGRVNGEFNEYEELNQGDYSKPSKMIFTRKAASQQEHKTELLQQQLQQDLIISSENELEKSEQQIRLLKSLSQDFILRLPQNDLSYLNKQLKKNSFFFNIQFYIRLKQIIQKLSLSDDLLHFLKSTYRASSLPTSLIHPPTLFSSQLSFLTQIIDKLQMIQELNKKFTLAMQDDQEEELAEVVMKSKQLTFEVNQDGDVVKKIVGLVVEGRVDSNKYGQQDEEMDEQTDKYKGIYYLIVKLVLKQQPSMRISPLPQQQLTHLKKLYQDAASSSIFSRSHFLTTCTSLYLLHSQLNQLQYIKNISETIFTYLTKHHAILIAKINQIKELSTKYAEPPQAIFAKLMQSSIMIEYLTGLGEMAAVAERLCGLGRRIGMKFGREEFQYDRLAKTIAETRQLAVKYNLLRHSSSNSQHLSQTIYTPYLTLLLSMISSGKQAHQISQQMRLLLKDQPICKICLTPRNSQTKQQGDFISNAVTVSSQSLGSGDSIQWCHFSCYNMLKIAFQDASDVAIGVEGNN